MECGVGRNALQRSMDGHKAVTIWTIVTCARWVISNGETA